MSADSTARRFATREASSFWRTCRSAYVTSVAPATSMPPCCAASPRSAVGRRLHFERSQYRLSRIRQRLKLLQSYTLARPEEAANEISLRLEKEGYIGAED